MKTLVLAVLLSSMVLTGSVCHAQPASGNSGTDASRPPTRTVTGTPSNGTVAQEKGSSKRNSSALNFSKAAPEIVAPPADITSLNAKEILAANNQVVTNLASMYQSFGLFITIIVTLVGVAAAVVSYLIKRNVREFIQEWTEKLKVLENEFGGSKKKIQDVEKEIDDSSKKLLDAVAESQASAKKAAEHAQESEDNKKLIDQVLKDHDVLRAQLDALGGKNLMTSQLPADGAPRTVAKETVQAEPQAAEEDAEVAAKLKDKLDSGQRKGHE